MADGSLHATEPTTRTPVAVRVGTPDDIHPMMDVALMATAENGLIKPDTNKLLENIWAALNLDNGIVGIIGEPGGLVEAALLMRIGPLWYGDDESPVLEEKALFTHPQYRSAKGGRASRLLEFGKDVANQTGLPLVIGVLSMQRAASKVRLYHRHFGEPVGAYWVYRGGETAS